MTLEGLLNKLIELGWRPRGYENILLSVDSDGDIYISNKVMRNIGLPKSLNELCSIESELRQFVCEKGLYNKERKQSIKISYVYTQKDYEYRLMLSSIQEDKSKFLLYNITIPNE